MLNEIDYKGKQHLCLPLFNEKFNILFIHLITTVQYRTCKLF